MNPEFKRNLWQEFSVQRLVAMPIILLAIFFITWKIGSIESFSSVAFGLIYFFLVIWGSGAASDAIFQEIRDHTWDSLRMTPIRPWSMAWGKLLGSTAFVWYGAGWCLIALLLGLTKTQGQPQNLSFQLLFYFLLGLFAQALGLFTALSFQRISPIRTRARTVFIQIFSIFVTSILLVIARIKDPSFFDYWYNLGLSLETMVIGSLIFFCISLLFGIYRLVRSELQMRSYPWGLPLFLIVWILYLWGFPLYPGNNGPQSFSFWINDLWGFKSNITLQSVMSYGSLFAGIAFGSFFQGTFLSAFFSPKSSIYYYRWINYLKEKKYKLALSLTPSWLLTGVLTFITLLFLILSLHRAEEASELKIRSMAYSISIFLFLIRDLGILYFITLNVHAKRAHLAAIVYLLVLYILVPLLIQLTPIPAFWRPTFNPLAWLIQTEPVTGLQIMLIALLIAIQGFFAWIATVKRWRANVVQLA